MSSVPNGRHQNTPRGKVPPSLRTDIYAHAHVPSWNPRTHPVAPQFGPSLPFPNPRPLLFSSVTVSLPPSPPPTRLPIPAAVVFLSSSSAGDLRIATSNRLFPCPFVGSTDLQYCDCESSAFFTRLHHPLASDPAASNNPPPAPSFPTILATHLAFAYPLLGTGRTPRTELFISHREQFHTATIVFAYTVEDLVSTPRPTDRYQITSGKKVTVWCRAHDNFPLLSLRRHLVSPHLSSIILSCRQIVVSKATRDTVFNGDVA
ncbi:hypothetical protein CABS03_10069 [Colletotrichum abscissum]|uniref:Uncharacterized protein n=1 Tax=Colletotrichum abscissum TaxID=1671311 RepID=A0A9P9XCM2_9PEZI|nr:hypothetical protein CABS02_08543 [Colletotrichum abscissum]